MIKNESKEIWVDLSRGRGFAILRVQAQNLKNKILSSIRDNWYLHVQWRWRSKWLRRVGEEEHVYIIKVALIAAYIDSHHCINNGDLLYYTEASSRQHTLRVTEISKPQVIRPGQVPPISVPYKVKVFERKQIAIAHHRRIESDRDLPIEYFDNYWERVS